MQTLSLPLSEIVDNLNRRNPFSLVRYGDGEFQAILNLSADGKNCDGVLYTPALADALAKTLTSPHDYFYCIGPKASSEKLAQRVEQWVQRHAPDLIWFDSEAMLEASVSGRLFPFIQALRQRRVMLVGGSHLQRVPKTFRPHVHIQIPRTQAFDKIEQIEEIVRANLADVDVILFAAGPCAKVLIHRLYSELKETHTLIDIGSLLDMHAGVDSRRYARAMGIDRKRALTHLDFYGK